jgi:hypothetical protein
MPGRPPSAAASARASPRARRDHRVAPAIEEAGLGHLPPPDRWDMSLRAWATTADGMPFELDEIMPHVALAHVDEELGRLGERASWG